MDNADKKLKLSFFGGAGLVTGANFILETTDDEQKQTRIMIDCGLVQGDENDEKKNYELFKYDISSIDSLFVTHAHIDHIGRIPKLVKDGFRGMIFSTPATKEISELLLYDELKILNIDTKKGGLEPLFDEKNIKKTMSLWSAIDYHDVGEVEGGFSFSFKDAGHILGSAIVQIEYFENRIAFTGDLGNSPSPLLRDTEFVNADYIVMESVYGDRNHDAKEKRTQIFEEVIKKTISRGGTLLIPLFSVEKTQVLLRELNNIFEKGNVKQIPIFLDSPLAINTMEIYKKYPGYFNEDAKKAIKSGDDIFNFSNLKLTPRVADSNEIVEVSGPKIIIAGSGMSRGGRILFHESIYLPDPKNTILFVGYQPAGTLGRKILDGVKKIEINKKKIKIKANVEEIMSYSNHKDSDGLFNFIEKAENPEKVFLVMGEPKASLFLAQRIRDYLNIETLCPREGDTYDLPIYPRQP